MQGECKRIMKGNDRIMGGKWKGIKGMKWWKHYERKWKEHEMEMTAKERKVIGDKVKWHDMDGHGRKQLDRNIKEQWQEIKGR